ncbi:hypothetical protein QN397_24275 [Variovorax sp. RTB1]|uniref:hypothetical protein n=1 Tax=Variovorax sp. RTB1 TaxID=3048631 RepID=UPI002B221C38|nr:hypothetical protein [Variovorax sp. RTB1]MEB0114401.1 hypothetical protein [Variovorax sp. RTB1]
MTYSPCLFADELDRLLAAVGDKDIVEEVGNWAYLTKLKHRNLDSQLSGWLDQLGVMTMGTEFELSLHELRAMVATARSE